MPKHSMKSKMGTKNGNKSAKRERGGMRSGGKMEQKKKMGPKGYARGGVVSYSEDMPRLTPN